MILYPCNGCEVDRKGGRGSFDVRCFASEGGRGSQQDRKKVLEKRKHLCVCLGHLGWVSCSYFFLLCHWLGQTPVEFTVSKYILSGDRGVTVSKLI